jgi:hypothetical protein
MKHEGYRTFLYWLPRGVAILFICFLSIFALDVFSTGQSIGYILTALFMHLIPNYILIAILLIAWRDEYVGCILFFFSAVCFTLFFKTYRFFPNFMLISFPLFIIAALFFTHYFVENKKKFLSQK